MFINLLIGIILGILLYTLIINVLTYNYGNKQKKYLISFTLSIILYIFAEKIMNKSKILYNYALIVSFRLVYLILFIETLILNWANMHIYTKGTIIGFLSIMLIIISYSCLTKNN